MRALIALQLGCSLNAKLAGTATNWWTPSARWAAGVQADWRREANDWCQDEEVVQHTQRSQQKSHNQQLSIYLYIYLSIHPKEPFQVSTQADACTFVLQGVVAMCYWLAGFNHIRISQTRLPTESPLLWWLTTHAGWMELCGPEQNRGNSKGILLLHNHECT